MNQRNPNEIDREAGEPERVISSNEEATVHHDVPVTTRRRQILIISLTIAVLLILLVYVLWIWRWRKAPAEEEKTKPTVSIKVSKAEKGAIATEISAVGTIWPRDKAEVAAKVSAQIRTMALLKNKFVKAGEVIAVLESRDLRAQRAEAAAALNEARASERSLVTGTIPPTNAQDQKALLDARAKVNHTRAVYERRRVLYEKGGISKKDLEASQLDLTTAEDELRLQEQTVALRAKSLNPNDRALAAAKVAEAQQHLATLDAQLSYATIRSPITGIVTDQFQYEGEFAATGAKLVSIADVSQVIVKAPFADTVVAKLKVGDAASVQPTDAPGQEMKGQISLLGRSSDPTNRTVEVWVTLGNSAGQLRANGAAQVTVFAELKTDAVVVPASAVTLEATNADEG